MPSSRRRILASLGASVIGLAGCNADPTTGATGTTTADEPTGTTTAAPGATSTTLGGTITTDGTDVTVSNLVDAHSFLYLSAPDEFGVTVADGQFAFVTVDASGERPPRPDAFAMTFDDGRRSATTFRDYGPVGDLPVASAEYSIEESDGYLTFELPAPLDAETVAVALDDARWSIPASVRAPLRSPPPSFAVDDDVPAAVPADEPIPVVLEVSNEGDGDGTFRGAINHHGPMHGAERFAFPLAAGESRTHEETIDYHLHDGFPYDRLQFAISTPAGDRPFSVRLDGGGTKTAGGTATATTTE